MVIIISYSQKMCQNQAVLGRIGLSSRLPTKVRYDLFNRMSLWGKCLERSAGYARRLRSFWYRQRFLWLEGPRHRLLELGKGVAFHVPVKGGQGTLRIGAGTSFGFHLAHRLGNGEILVQARVPEAEIIIGKGGWISNNALLHSMRSIRIGDDCRIGECAAIYDADFHEVNPATRNHSAGIVKPVVIGSNVWIGARAMILKGVTIGDNSVIGAMSLVTKDIPANCVAAGVPAKVIRSISEGKETQ